MTEAFEGSYAGDANRIQPNSKLECKICWYVYDPHVGCDVWQIPPETPFASLPEEWSCPNCDGRKDGFMVVAAE